MGAAATYPVVIGGGGPGNQNDPSPKPNARGSSGGSSGMPTLVPAGGVAGGGGGGAEASNPDGNTYPGISRTSASGGGANNQKGDGGTATNPNTGAGPYGSPGHGNPQGDSWGDTGGGGGGAGGQLNTAIQGDPGAPYVPGDAPPLQLGSYGGFGKEIPWIPGTVAGVASPTGTAYFAGGGMGGGSQSAAHPPGSTGPTMDYRWAGCGNGGSNPGYGGDAVANTGSGGGGGGYTPVGSRKGGDGADGVVVVRYAEEKTMEATGGTIVDAGGYRSHFFTSPGTFTVTSGTKGVQYLIVAGGGSGGGKAPNGVVASGGGGAGGLISSFPEGPGGPVTTADAGVEVSPTGGPTSNGQYAVTVGEGGVGGPTSPDPTFGRQGNDSQIVFSPTDTRWADGGGRGGAYQGTPAAQNGGSGGGGGYSEDAPSPKPGGDATDSGVSGYPGGYGRLGASGGGGGAGAAGSPANPGPTAPVNGGAGGDGKGFADIPPSYGTPGPSPTLRYFAGGGGGGAEATRLPSVAGAGGVGGGGAGAQRDPSPTVAGSGTANTGGGGGGGHNKVFPGGPTIGSGADGIVIIRYAYSS
jgi:hypothetical protein